MTTEKIFRKLLRPSEGLHALHIVPMGEKKGPTLAKILHPTHKVLNVTPFLSIYNKAELALSEGWDLPVNGHLLPIDCVKFSICDPKEGRKLIFTQIPRFQLDE